MGVETLTAGTMGELAGMAVGSGNVWVRDGHDGRLSASLALPDETTVVVALGDSVVIDGRACTLVDIEHRDGGRHLLRFEVEEPEVDPEPRSAPDAAAASEPAPAGGGRSPSTILRERTPQVMALLGVTVASAASDAWERVEREYWNEIDRVQVGPNTDTTWTLRPAGHPNAHATVRLEVVRWNPQEVHRVSVSGYWTDGDRHIFAVVDESTGQINVSGTDHLLDAATAALAIA